MKRIMKHFLLIFLFWGISVCSYGQFYKYTYDASGNRTIRKYSMTYLTLNEEVGNEAETKSRLLKRYEVKVTGGDSDAEIHVQVSGLDNQTKGKVWVYTTSGVQVMQINIIEESTTVNLSSLPAGVYLLRVILDEETYGWKITKEF